MSIHQAILMYSLATLLTATTRLHLQVSLQDSSPNSSTHYEIAGPYNAGNELSRREKDEILTRIREFLWDHYDGRMPGKLEATFYTIEGEPTHYLFFVDTGPTGEWGIRATISMWRRDYARHKKKPTQTVVEEKYCYVGRTDPSSEKAIPREEKRTAESYRLVLRVCTDDDITF
jgi:hypothetical protein